ncbi:hypothetical protein N9216_01465 [Pseudomonadales bacterium]|nr:hypothetical protein [Pseudomonadales bacterium]
MADKQTQLFIDGADSSSDKKKDGSTINEAKTKKRVRKPSKKRAKKVSSKRGDLVLLPFSIGSLSRSLAACRITGMARGDESDDLQARTAGFLVGFIGTVPDWALSACSFEGISPVLVAVELDKGMYREKNGYLEVDPVLPTSVVKYLAFDSIENQENFISRVKRFPDVPLSLFDTKEQASAFGAADPNNEVSASSIVSGDSQEDISHRVRLSQLGGVIACLKDSLHIDNATDDVIFRALGDANANTALPLALYGNLDMKAGPIDERVWVAAYKKIESISAKEGVDVFRFMDELVSSLSTEISDVSKQSLDQWSSFSKSVLEGDRDMPKAYEDSVNNALRAVLLFLICKGYAGLRELMAHTPVGPRVRALAFALCGLYDRIDRLPLDMKGNNREELDCLSQIVIDTESDRPVVLEASGAQWGADFAMRSQVLRDGKAFAERAIDLPGDLIELFAKARRQNLMVQYDTDYRSFFFPLPVDEGSSGDGDKLYIEVMESTTKSRQARFYMPIIKLTARGLGKKGYEDLLELAWEQCMSIGKVAIGGKGHICVFGVQLIDTFDQEEFDGLLRGFQNVLTNMRS